MAYILLNYYRMNNLIKNFKNKGCLGEHQ